MYEKLSTPLIKATISIKHTFEDMGEGETRFFQTKHAHRFRVFAGRLNKQLDTNLKCDIIMYPNYIEVTKRNTNEH